MKILVCGSRDWNDYTAIRRELDKLYHIQVERDALIIIQGGARGADAIARGWAERNGVPCVQVDANWVFYGKSAGPISNEWMLRLDPDLVLAFSVDLDHSKGTKNMVTQALKAGVKVLSFEA